MSDLVWYAAYGSNLSRDRFDFYLRGGRPPGATHDYPGSRDTSVPADDRPWEIAPELGFGGTSKTWGGGVAFVDPDSTGGAKARLYLITLEQFADVVAQENWLAPGSVAVADVGAEVHLGVDRMYGLVVPLGELDGYPVATFTQHRGAVAAAPSIAYLGHIARGLREAHGMSDDEIVAYLVTKPGMTYEEAVLIEAIAGTV
jgi:hypothetical protein